RGWSRWWERRRAGGSTVRRRGPRPRPRSAASPRRSTSRTTAGSDSASHSSGTLRLARPLPPAERFAMPLLKGNLHAHTTFSAGRRSIYEGIARYRDLGYDFLAITHHADRILDDYWFSIPPGDDRLLVIPGVELDYEPLSQHVGKVIGDRETLYVLTHPARYALTVDETLHRIQVI